MTLIKCEINLILTLPENYVMFSVDANQAITFAKTDAELYVPLVTLSTQSNARVEQLKKLKLDFKRIINWNKYQ